MNTTDRIDPQEFDLRIAEYVLGVLDAKESAEVAEAIFRDWMTRIDQRIDAPEPAGP